MLENILVGLVVVLVYGAAAGGLFWLLFFISGWWTPRERKCRVCRCTNSRACPGGCHWVEPDLCSECVDVDSARPAREGMFR